MRVCIHFHHLTLNQLLTKQSLNLLRKIGSIFYPKILSEALLSLNSELNQKSDVVGVERKQELKRSEGQRQKK